MTQDQRFFVAAAYIWAEEIREDAQRLYIEIDDHAPYPVRAVQPARNMDAFYEAFCIAPGDPMYLPPAERIVIW